MLKVFEEFREKLDEIITKYFGSTIVLYGYGYSERFLEWYAEYYHGIKVDFIITDDWSSGVPYNFPLFRESLFEFNYMDVKDAIVWLAVPNENVKIHKIEQYGYRKDETYINFFPIIYSKNYMRPDNIDEDDIFKKKKNGLYDIQFMEWLEYMYHCDFITAIDSSKFKEAKNGGHSYRITTQKEIFPILDKCHCLPQENDAIFDFGCGKGGAMVAFLDYGFRRVGGVEFESKIYEIMLSNFEKMGLNYSESIDDKELLCLHKDASLVTTELDGYNWFYYFDPFAKEIFLKTIENICDSLRRNPRKVHIININPKFYDVILDSGYFVLTNQICVSMRQKVVDIFVSKKKYER